jgi:hypothetical protein
MAAARAIEEVEDGMILGWGSGLTAAFAIEALAARIAKNLRIVGRIVIGGFLPMSSQGRRSRSSGSWAALPFTCTFRCVARSGMRSAPIQRLRPDLNLCQDLQD